MLNNDKIKIMTKLALYEQKEGRKNLAGAKYYRSDYISLGMINSAIVSTLAFILIVACIVVVNIENLIAQITSMDMIQLGRILIIIYIAYMIVYLTISYIVYRLRYENIKDEIKSYDNNLKELYTIYKDEEKSINKTAEVKIDNLDVAIMEED